MSEPALSILVAEDDPSVRTFLADNLTADGYELHVAETIRDAVRVLEYKQPDLAILDVGMPDGSGLDLLRRVRESDAAASRMDPTLPVLVLTGHATELDRIRGFEKGADDYLAKPFSYGELKGRVGALLRRCHAREAGGRLRVGDLEVDALSRDVTLRGQRIELSQKEFALLRALAVEPTRVFHKADLLRDVWGFRSMGTTRTLDSHACRLRHKLGVTGDRYIINVWGVGYRLIDGPVAAVAA